MSISDFWKRLWVAYEPSCPVWTRTKQAFRRFLIEHMIYSSYFWCSVIAYRINQHHSRMRRYWHQLLYTLKGFFKVIFVKIFTLTLSEYFCVILYYIDTPNILYHIDKPNIDKLLTVMKSKYAIIQSQVNHISLIDSQNEHFYCMSWPTYFSL